MALKKQVELYNGIITNYHRIVSINKITNNCNIIEVASYISEQQREKEKEYYNSTNENKSMNIFIETSFVQKEYSENETLEQFKEASDV